MGRELVLFMNSLWYGAILCMIYDCLRILRKVFLHSKIMAGAEDLLFWIGSSLFVFSGFFRENAGVLRGYLLAGVGAGALAWHFSLSRYFVRYVGGILKKGKEILGIPLRKAVILAKRLKFYISRCRISVYEKHHRNRGAKYGQKEKDCKKKKWKSKTQKRAE